MAKGSAAAAAAFVLGVLAALAAPAVGQVKLWNAELWQRPGLDAQEDQAGPLRPMELAAPRNGMASGQIVVNSPEGLPHLSAAVSDLKSAQGAVIPASSARIRYAKVGKGFMPLLDAPPAGEKVQPVCLTVKVPADAAPGKYAGTLTLRGVGRPAAVAVELAVSDWKAPSPRDWRNWVNVLQSPESVAGHYKVPMWSDRHFQLMEKSIELMGQAGNDVLGVLAVGQTVFGNDPIIVFRREGGTYVPELKFLQRYLRLYDKHAGAPKFFSVNVWSYGMHHKGYGRDGGTEEKTAETVPIVELRGSELLPVHMPMYGKPGTEEVWRKVMNGVRKTLDDLGWHQTAVLLGTSGDTWPSAAQVAFFKKIALWAQWRALTHGCGCPKWGDSDSSRTQPNGMIVGYLEIARRIPNRRGKLDDRPVTCNSRDNVGTNPLTYLGLAAVTTLGYDYDGFCWKGIDYWTYTTAEGASRNALNYYLKFGNMVGGTPRAMAVPGPDGAAPTVQFQLMLEGTQACEAALAVRENLNALYPDPVKKCDVIELYLQDALWTPNRREPDKINSTELSVMLYYHDGGIGLFADAPTYNTGKHAGQAKALETRQGLRFDLQVALGDDPWVPGGDGRYDVTVVRDGDSISGAYSGAYKGQPRKGAVTGCFRAKGYAQPTDQPAPRSELALRWEKAVKEVLGRLDEGQSGKPKIPSTHPSDLRNAIAQLYAAAAESAAVARK